MSNATTDDVKGRLKEAAGSLTGDEKLKNEGRVDQASGKLKKKAGELVDKVRDAVSGDDKS